MEKNPFHKNNGLSKTDTSISSGSDKYCNDHCENGAQISEYVDHFINVLSAVDNKSLVLSEVLDFVDFFSKIIESRISGYNSCETNRRFGKLAEEDSFFMESVRLISKLMDTLGEFPLDTKINSLLNRTSITLEQAMVFLEEEFRALLENSRNDLDHPENFHEFLSSNSNNQQDNCNRHVIWLKGGSDAYQVYSLETVTKLHEIAMMMISTGYETECCQVYYISRRNAIRNYIIWKFEIILNMDDVAKMPFDPLEAKVRSWIRALEWCSKMIFPEERRLGESVFPSYPQIHRKILRNIMHIVVSQLLDFAEAMVIAKHSEVMLFMYLDMYEALQSLILTISDESCSDELMLEVTNIVDRIGESALRIFRNLENFIETNTVKTPVPGGAVHPLTRYVMTYLHFACHYRYTLEKICSKQIELNKKYIPITKDLTSQDLEKESESQRNFQMMDNMTSLLIQVVRVMNLLDANLDKKSKLYKDPSLRYVFLMNNGRYILQKVKRYPELREIMDDAWCWQRSTVVKMYCKNYQRETWNRVLQCLNHDELMVNGKINKPHLKEKFKILTTTFKKIHKTQSTWALREDLQSELQIFTLAVVIPAYRSFVGQFRQYLGSEKQANKYIKYQPENVEALIKDLFKGNINIKSIEYLNEGSTTSQARWKNKLRSLISTQILYDCFVLKLCI